MRISIHDLVRSIPNVSYAYIWSMPSWLTLSRAEVLAPVVLQVKLSEIQKLLALQMVSKGPSYIYRVPQIQYRSDVAWAM